MTAKMSGALGSHNKAARRLYKSFTFILHLTVFVEQEICNICSGGAEFLPDATAFMEAQP